MPVSGDRVRFEVADASTMPDRTFDLLCYFDCVHDMGDPVGALGRAREALKPNGTLMIVEPFAEENLEQNLTPIGRIFYGASTMLCTPASLAQDVGSRSARKPGRAGRGRWSIRRASHFRRADGDPVQPDLRGPALGRRPRSFCGGRGPCYNRAVVHTSPRMEAGCDGSTMRPRPKMGGGREPERYHHDRRHHAGALGGGRPFRPSNAPLEPEDEAVHLSRAQRHLHHRLAQTVARLRDVYEVVKQLAREGRVILFVGTKKQAQDVVREEAERAGTFYVNQRWLGRHADELLDDPESASRVCASSRT